MKSDLITKAICLCSIDYKEKDKQVTIFSLENGKINAVLKGCRAQNSKLKFASNPFCFAEYNLVQNGDFYTITNASLLDSFFDLSKNIENYYIANAMLDITQNIVRFDESNPQIFVQLLSALKSICYDAINSRMVLIKFCLNVLENLGYKLSFKSCSKCDMPYNKNKFLDLSCGEIVCQNCKTLSCNLLSNACFNALKIITENDYDRFNSIKLKNEVLDECIENLILDIESRLDKQINSRKILKLII